MCQINHPTTSSKWSKRFAHNAEWSTSLKYSNSVYTFAKYASITVITFHSYVRNKKLAYRSLVVARNLYNNYVAVMAQKRTDYY